MFTCDLHTLYKNVPLHPLWWQLYAQIGGNCTPKLVATVHLNWWRMNTKFDGGRTATGLDVSLYVI